MRNPAQPVTARQPLRTEGAMLVMSWFDDPYRGTRNLDLLGFWQIERGADAGYVS